MKALLDDIIQHKIKDTGDYDGDGGKGPALRILSQPEKLHHADGLGQGSILYQSHKLIAHRRKDRCV